MNTKKTKGRQKIEIKKVEHEASREVTFSKRKKGLFNKAGELSELCGAEVALVLFSPHHKPYTFGHPDTDRVLERYLTGTQQDTLVPLCGDEDLHALNAAREQYKESLKWLEEEEKKSKEKGHVGSSSSSSSGGFWWDQGVENIEELDELEQYLESMKKLKKVVQDRLDSLSGNHNNEASDIIPNQFINFNFNPHDYGFDGV